MTRRSNTQYDQWKNSALQHRIYMSKLRKTEDTTLRGLARKLAKRKKGEDKT